MASPPDFGHRWATITPDDRSGVLYIIAFLSFTYSSITFLTRCFIKRHMLGIDDAANALAQVANLVQFALLLAALSDGLAKNFDLLRNDDYARMATMQFGNQIALYVSLGFSKLSTILFIRRLFTRDMKKAWIICNSMTAIAVAWTVLAAFLVSVGCSPESLAPTMPSQTCPSIVARYEAVVITDAVTDFALVIIPSLLCWDLHMSTMLKLQVLAVFAVRLPLVALSGLFLKRWTYSLVAPNPGVRRTSALVFQQSELCWSLMAATIPCLKSFLRSFDTGSGVKATMNSSNEFGSSDHNGSGSRTGGESHELSTLDRSKAASSIKQSWRSPRDDGTVRVNLRPFTSARPSSRLRRKKSPWPSLEAQDNVQEADGQSQHSRKELFIRRERHYEVTSEVARADSDVSRPGILRLPK
ncbi:hypothetical protein DE146DRAFT_621468 [Phaeosphaeria sp. MPI-PUGE-AT-0046c]|nr:hypothetical protein DE146DRAFT_621468 [Phaeosphaeria sp. MPI-PUGE-AT-0046c]